LGRVGIGIGLDENRGGFGSKEGDGVRGVRRSLSTCCLPIPIVIVIMIVTIIVILASFELASSTTTFSGDHPRTAAISGVGTDARLAATTHGRGRHQTHTLIRACADSEPRATSKTEQTVAFGDEAWWDGDRREGVDDRGAV
jgi:hypothetical protein